MYVHDILLLYFLQNSLHLLKSNMKPSINFVLAVLLALAATSSAFQNVLLQTTRSCVKPIAMSENPSAAEESAEDAQPTKADVACPDCDLCDGSGRYVFFLEKAVGFASCCLPDDAHTVFFFLDRIAGGIGAVLPWIPIKAYRPCPNFVERGGVYQRTGQALDEIAFGKKQK